MSKEIICCKCECIETSKWIRYKDKRGKWDGKSYLCRICYGNLKKYGTTDKDQIEKQKEKYNEFKRNNNKNKKSKISCYICGNRETGKNFNGEARWNRYRGNDGKNAWDGKSYICDGCYIKIYNRYSDNDEKISQLRKGFISKYSDKGKGIIVEIMITKARNAKNFNLELDNFNAPFDIIDTEFNRLQVKGPTLIRKLWSVNIGIEHNFDNLFVVCMDRNRENIKRIYVIPESELFGETHIYIHEDFSILYRSSKFEWVEQFRNNDINNLKLYNDSYHSFMAYLKSMEYFSIEDVKKWMALNV